MKPFFCIFRYSDNDICEIDFRRNEENLIAGEEEDGNNNEEDKIGESQLGQDVKDDSEEKDLDVEKMKSQGKNLYFANFGNFFNILSGIKCWI